jgi:cyanate permease
MKVRATRERLRGAMSHRRVAELSFRDMSVWLPADMVTKGFSVGVASEMVAESALIAFMTIFLTPVMHSQWSTKWSVVVMIGMTSCRAPPER